MKPTSKFCYPSNHLINHYRDLETHDEISEHFAKSHGYVICDSKLDANLQSSRYHHPDCQCNICTMGIDAYLFTHFPSEY